MNKINQIPTSKRRERIHEIIFEADSPEGRLFDIVLLIMILGSIIVVALESIDHLDSKYGNLFLTLEWCATIFFTIEYGLRLYCVKKPSVYAFSFFGIIDFLAIIPTYLSFFFAGSQTLLVIRALRLLRVFRIFKLMGFLHQAKVILAALRSSREKIFVFFFFVILVATILGSIMYLVEGSSNPDFSDIPTSIYWSIVTMTTVGYGDITPVTALGKFISAFIMILGYSIIAVPTGIVTAQFLNRKRVYESSQVCQQCLKEGHEESAHFCNECGYSLDHY